MLTSISPLGEQARGQRYGLTVAAHLLGGALGGATTGAVLGGVGALLDPPVLLAVPVLLGAAAADARGVRIGRRQVDEDWLGRYRGWVYGGGYGVQLGLGVVTVVTSAATPALLAVLVLLAGPWTGALVGAVFGVTRGLPLLALRRADTPQALRHAAARLERAAGPGPACDRGGAPARRTDDRTARVMLASGGLSVRLPPGWEVRVRQQPPSGRDGSRNLLLHAATVPLPAERGDFGSGVGELLGPDDAFVALLEYDSEDVDSALFEARGLPVVRPGDFSPSAMQQQLPGRSGAQWFFTVAYRPFCLYAVLGSHSRRAAGAATVTALVRAMDVEAR